jgi:hypothetical protein
MPRCLMIGTVFSLWLAACQSSGPSVPRSTSWSFLSRPEADTALKGSDPFRLDSARVEGDSLILFVAYGGGCRQHVFSPFSSDYVLKSLPPQVDLWFVHDADGDACEAFIHRRLAFDVRPAAEKLQGEGTLRLHAPGDSLLLLPYPPGR